MGVQPATLATLAIDDPYESVVMDVAALRANPKLPGGIVVTGLVYDVATGLVRTVVPSQRLRPESAT
jgi:carbonic anhydrase